MNRRTFLRSATFLAGSALAISRSVAAPAPGNVESGRRIRAGLLGGAHSHGLGKASVLVESKDYELVGIHEPDPKVRARYQELSVPALGRDELLLRSDLVVVESAVGDLCRNARLALQAGKHVHVEKPPSTDFGSFRELVSLARRQKRLLQPGYMWRHNPAFNAALSAARQGWLGDIYRVRGTMNTLIDATRRPDWAQFRGGAMFEQGCHLIDQVVRLLGRPERVSPFLKHHGKFADDLADNTLVVLEYPSALATVSNATLQPGAGAHRSFEILGTKGTAVVRPIEPPTLAIDLTAAAGPYRTGLQSVPMPAYERYVGDFEELAAAVRGEKPLSVTLDQELVIQETVLRASRMQ